MAKDGKLVPPAPEPDTGFAPLVVFDVKPQRDADVVTRPAPETKKNSVSEIVAGAVTLWLDSGTSSQTIRNRSIQ